MRTRTVALRALLVMGLVGCQLLGSIEPKALAPASGTLGDASTDGLEASSCGGDVTTCRGGVPSRCVSGEWKSVATCGNEASACSLGACVRTRGLALGGPFTCALTRDGRVRCSGENSDGALGDGTTKDRKDPVYVEGLTDVADVAAGADFACAITWTGDVQCWGANLLGELADPSVTTYYRARSAPAPALTKVLALALGSTLGCALRKGEVLCWGGNSYGQLGDGTTNAHRTPAPVVGLPAEPTQVAAGNRFACAVLSDGNVFCWGNNAAGQLGDGSHLDSRVPTRVHALGPAARVALGTERACAALRDGTVWCWGGTAADAGSPSPPSQVGGLAGVVDVRLGYAHACALTGDGALLCWGDDLYGQLGRNRTRPGEVAPIMDLAVVIAFDAGADHTCARDATGSLFCWGYNAAGQLGDGSTTSQYRPTLVLP